MTIIFFLLLTLAGIAAADGERALTEGERVRFKDAFAKLGSELYRERKAAAEAIAALGPPVLGLLVKRKGDPDPEVQEAVERLIKAIKLQAARRRIVRLIKESGVDDDPEAILKKYSSPREEDRMEALISLTLRHTPACVPIVKEFLEDPSGKVVDAAIGELRQVVKGKDQDIALRILALVDRTSLEQERMFDRISALLNFADFRHEDLLKALKNLQSSKTRQIVFARMALVPEENFVFAFAAMLDDKDRSMRRFCAGGIELVVRDVLQKKRREMFNFNKSDMKRLSKLLAPHLDSEDLTIVQVATRAIGRTGVPDCADKLITLLKSEDIVTVRHAAISLGLVKAGKAAPALIGILKKGRYEALPECADALARIGDPTSFAPLLELLKKKSVPFRVLLLYAMTAVDLRRSTPELLAFLCDRDVTVRSLAVDRLVTSLKKYPKLQNSKMPDLLQIVREGKQMAKTAAARVIGEVGGIAILPDLKKLAASGDPRVRSAALAPVAMIAQEGAQEFLKEKLKDADYQVRVNAAAALGYLGDWSEFLKVRLIPLKVKGRSVVEALESIAFTTGMNLVIDPGAVRMCSLDTCIVTGKLRGKTIKEGFEALKKSFELSWDSRGYAVFVTVKAREKILEEFNPPTAGVGCTRADLAIEKKLRTRLSCDSISERIETFLEGLSAKTGIDFELDKSVDESLAEQLLRVDFTASDVPLVELLRLVLAPRKLRAKITGGKVVISPRK